MESRGGTNQEIEKLNNLVKEYEKRLRAAEEKLEHKNIQLKNFEDLKLEQNDLKGENVDVMNLVSKNHIDMIHDEELKKMASSAHKQIKTLQEMLNMKNIQLQRKEDIIENLKKDLIANKTFHLNKIQDLQSQIAR
jgi:hypothetical protein